MKFVIVRTDITQLNVEAIVTASNESCNGCHIPGHCIDSAVHYAAGPKLLEACEKLKGVPTSCAKITPGFNLNCKYILHATGPRAQKTKDGTIICDFEALANTYIACLDLAAQHNIQQLVFCCISTGVFGFPKEKSAQVATATVRNWMLENAYEFREIVFCVFGYEDEALYRDLLFPDQEE